MAKKKIGIDISKFLMSTQSHSYNISVAVLFKCSDTATILNDLMHWRAVNVANKANFIDGNYWTFMTVKAWNDKYPYMLPNKIRGILDRLEENDFLISAQHDKNKYNRTKWYALTEKACETFNLPFVKITNGEVNKTNDSVNKTNVICQINKSKTNDFSNNLQTNKENTHSQNFSDLKEERKEEKEKGCAKKEKENPDEETEQGGNHVEDNPRTEEQIEQIKEVLSFDIETPREYLSGASMRTDFAKILNSDKIYMESWKETLNGYYISNDSETEKQVLREWVLKILGQYCKNLGNGKTSPITIFKEVLSKVGWAANEIKTNIESLKTKENVKPKGVVLS